MNKLNRPRAESDDFSNNSNSVLRTEDESINVQKEITTVIIDDGSTVKKDISSNKRDDVSEITYQTIKDFLGRPYYLRSFDWAAASTTGTILTNQQAMFPLRDATNFPLYTSKCEGFGYIRATAVLRIVINAQPFQAGRLLVSFMPTYNYATDSSSNRAREHIFNLCTRSQLPNIEIDARDTGAIFKVPYIAPTHWYDLLGSNSQPLFEGGSWMVSVLSPVRTGAAGEDTIKCAMYIYYEDVELMAPTFTQARNKKGLKVVGGKEASNVVHMPISEGLRLASKSMATFGKVPMLAPLMGPVGWATDVAAGLTSALGWSKPESEDSGERTIRTYNQFAPNSTGVDSSIQLGLQHNARLKTMDTLSIYDQDEMSFDFLKQQWAYIGTATWSTSNTVNTQIYTRTLRPADMALQSTQVHNGITATFQTGPPAWYLSNFFKQWRGGIEYRFRIVKTHFHTGRLQVTATYADSQGSSTLPSITQSTNNLRHIIDLVEGNEVCITFPFLFNRPYRFSEYTIGQFDIKVLNPLRAPETVSDTIEILVYTRGAPDFELQVPKQVTMYPFTPDAVQSGYDELVNDQIGGAQSNGPSTLHSEQCVGEHFTSVKQFLNRQTMIKFVSTQPSSSNSAIVMWPWLIATQTQDATLGTLVSGLAGYDAYNLLGTMYNFARGHPRITLRVTDTLTTNNIMTSFNVPPESSVYNNSVAGGSTEFSGQNTSILSTVRYVPLNGFHIADTNVGMVTVTAPYYNQYDCHIISPATSASTGLTDSDPRGALTFNVTNGLATYGLYRAFSDDTQLAYFLGAPPLLISIA